VTRLRDMAKAWRVWHQPEQRSLGLAPWGAALLAVRDLDHHPWTLPANLAVSCWNGTLDYAIAASRTMARQMSRGDHAAPDRGGGAGGGGLQTRPVGCAGNPV